MSQVSQVVSVSPYVKRLERPFTSSKDGFGLWTSWAHVGETQRSAAGSRRLVLFPAKPRTTNDARWQDGPVKLQTSNSSSHGLGPDENAVKIDVL